MEYIVRVVSAAWGWHLVTSCHLETSSFPFSSCPDSEQIPLYTASNPAFQNVLHDAIQKYKEVSASAYVLFSRGLQKEVAADELFPSTLWLAAPRQLSYTAFGDVPHGWEQAAFPMKRWKGPEG